MLLKREENRFNEQYHPIIVDPWMGLRKQSENDPIGRNWTTLYSIK
jgi:hypothetical protein